jgi:hypothetical protein
VIRGRRGISELFKIENENLPWAHVSLMLSSGYFIGSLRKHLLVVSPETRNCAACV